MVSFNWYHSLQSKASLFSLSSPALTKAWNTNSVSTDVARPAVLFIFFWFYCRLKKTFLLSLSSFLSFTRCFVPRECHLVYIQAIDNIGGVSSRTRGPCCGSTLPKTIAQQAENRQSDPRFLESCRVVWATEPPSDLNWGELLKGKTDTRQWILSRIVFCWCVLIAHTSHRTQWALTFTLSCRLFC